MKRKQTMLIFTVSDGVVSTQQILLRDESIDHMWQYAERFYERKNREAQSLANAEFMRMNGCERVRRYMFYYDLTAASKAVFADLMQKKNSKMSILIVLWPRTPRIVDLYPDITFPRIVNSVTGTVVDSNDLESTSYEGAFQDGKFTRDVGYVMRVFKEGSRHVERPLDLVDRTGRPLASQLMEDYLLPELETDAHNTLELTYHTQCGPMQRYFLQYDEDMTMPMLGNLLHGPNSPSKIGGGFRITFVPRTRMTEADILHYGDEYPVLINAGSSLVHYPF